MIKSNYEYGGDGSNSVEVLKHSRHKSMANLDSFETVKFDSPGTNMNSSKKDNSRINSQLSVRFSKDIDGSDSKRGLVPDYISPDDLVFVFKSCSNDK